MSHYNKSEFLSGLNEVDLHPGAVVFGHSNVGFFGIPEEGRSLNTSINIIFDAIFDIIGDDGTLVVPAFTYSFPQNQIFDVQESVGIGGSFAEYVRLLPESIRSIDPACSVAAIGKYAKELTHNLPNNSHGADSFFARFLKYNGVICNFNFDAASTFIHYVERELNVPYRFDKTFSGTIRDQGIETKKRNTIFVRYMNEQTEARFELFDQYAIERNLVKKAKVGRGSIKLMTARDQFRVVDELLPVEPWFLTKAGRTGIIPEIDLDAMC